MKKTYTKPAVFFESFTLCTAIAADCENTFGLQNKGTCAIPSAIQIPGVNMGIFNVGPGSECGVQGGDDSRYNGLCYHVPEGKNNLFNS